MADQNLLAAAAAAGQPLFLLGAGSTIGTSQLPVAAAGTTDLSLLSLLLNSGGLGNLGGAMLMRDMPTMQSVSAAPFLIQPGTTLLRQKVELEEEGPVQLPAKRPASKSLQPENSRDDCSSSDDDGEPGSSSRHGGKRKSSGSDHGNTAVTAKEKNRQAQRRFRERQKNLITNLKQKVENLSQTVSMNEKEIASLREENSILRAKLEGKQHQQIVQANLTIPPEALQQLLLSSQQGTMLQPSVLQALTGQGGLGGHAGLQGSGTLM